ncbi:MAG: 4Fe-4S binding protein, partial [Planctomycetota bacterium]
AVGVLGAAVFAAASRLGWGISAGSTALWGGWILFLATYLGYDLPSWSPLWRADLKEMALGKRHTHIEIQEDKCIGCHLCAVVCPVAVFARDPGTRKYSVADLDACQACGACVENCPADAIVTNFRSGICACPLCAAIQGVGVLKAKTRRKEEAMTENLDAGDACCGGGGTPSPEGAGPESSSSTCGCEPSRACGCGPSPGGTHVKRRLVILAMVAVAVGAVLWLKSRAAQESEASSLPASSLPARSGQARTSTVLLFADPRETDEDCGCAD